MKILVGCLSFNEFLEHEQYNYDLAECLTKGNEVHVVSNISTNTMVDAASELGITCHDIKYTPSYILGDGVRQYKIHGQNKVMEAGKFYRICKNDDFSILILSQSSITSVLSDLYKHVPAIQVIHSVDNDRFDAPIRHDNIKAYIAVSEKIKDHLNIEWGIDINDIYVVDDVEKMEDLIWSEIDGWDT